MPSGTIISQLYIALSVLKISLKLLLFRVGMLIAALNALKKILLPHVICAEDLGPPFTVSISSGYKLCLFYLIVLFYIKFYLFIFLLYFY